MAKNERPSIININEAIQNAYIHLMVKHVDKDEIKLTSAYFKKQAQENQQLSKKQAIEQLLNSTLVRINNNPVNTENFINTFGTTQLEESLGKALSEAADTMNEQFQNIEGSTLTDAVQKINSIIYSSTQMNKQTFNLWLDAIGEALQAVNIFPKGLDLIKIIEGSRETPTLINLSTEELKATNKIMQYIQKAYQNFQNGQLTKGSLIGTTRNIIGSQLGEIWGKQLLESLDESKFEQQIDAIVENTFKAKLSGTSRTTGSHTTAKPDIMTNKLFTSKISPNGDISGQVEILANASVKQSATLTPQHIRLVSGTPIKTVIEGSLEGYKYGTYNILAHYASFKNEYNDFKTFVAGSFINQYLMGTGQQLTNGGVDTAWFMLISGRAYSMLDIIDDIVKGNSSTITIEFPGISEVRKINKGQSTLEAAIERSNKAKEAINKLTITAILNANFYKT